MNWEAAGAIGEILGAAGVILTLIYLALQLRQNTKSTNANIVATHLQAYGDTIRVAGQSLENARTMRKGMNDLDLLDEDERSQFLYLIGQWLLAWDSLYALYKDGLLPESQWHRIRSDIRNAMSMAGFKEFDSDVQEILSPELNDEMERIQREMEVSYDPKIHLSSNA